MYLSHKDINDKSCKIAIHEIATAILEYDLQQISTTTIIENRVYIQNIGGCTKMHTNPYKLFLSTELPVQFKLIDPNTGITEHNIFLEHIQHLLSEYNCNRTYEKCIEIIDHINKFT